MLNAYNSLIIAINEAGLTQILYQLFNIVNITVLLLYCNHNRKHYGLSASKALLSIVILYALGYLWIYIIGWASTGFKHFGSNNIVKGFIYFPLIALLPCRLFNIDKAVMCDYCAPCMSLLQGVAHIACSFAGCCHGYRTDWGIWNVSYECYMFPIQLLESLVAFLIFAFIEIYSKKANMYGKGRLYPISLILFGSTRFFLEFLRDNKKVFFGISDLALHAGLMVLVGIAWLMELNDRERKKQKSAGTPKKSKAR